MGGGNQESEIRGDVRPIAQRERRRLGQVGDIVALEDVETVRAGRQFDGVVAGAVRQHAGHGGAARAIGRDDQHGRVRDVDAAALNRPGKRLRVGGIGHIKQGRHRRKAAGWAGEPEDVLADDLLSHVVGDAELSGDGAIGRSGITGDVDVGDPADHTGLAVGQGETPHQRIPGIHRAVPIDVEKLLHLHGLTDVQPRHLQRNKPGIRVADGASRNRKRHGSGKRIDGQRQGLRRCCRGAVGDFHDEVGSPSPCRRPANHAVGGQAQAGRQPPRCQGPTVRRLAAAGGQLLAVIGHVGCAAGE